MITDHIIGKLCKRRHRTALVLAAIAAGVLMLVGAFLSHEKVFEYGTLWLFEQCIGGAKRSLFGGPE